MHTVFALLCLVVVIHWLIFPYPSGLLHWHCGNLTIAPVPAKQPWWIWINTSCEFIMNDCITTTKQSTTKPCAYFLGYTVPITSNNRHQVTTSIIAAFNPTATFFNNVYWWWNDNDYMFPQVLLPIKYWWYFIRYISLFSSDHGHGLTLKLISCERQLISCRTSNIFHWYDLATLKTSSFDGHNLSYS